MANDDKTPAEIESQTDAINENTAAQKENTAAQKEARQETVEYLKAQRKLAEQMGDTAKYKALDKQIQQLTDSMSPFEKSLDKAAKTAARFESAGTDLGKELADLVPIIGTNTDILGGFGGKLAATAANANTFSQGINEVAGSFFASVTGPQIFSNVLSFATETLAGWIGMSVLMSTNLQEQTAAFNKATGAQGAYTGQIEETFRATVQMGVTTAEAAEATQALFLTSSRFTDMMPREQQALSNTVAGLNELGISNDAATESIHIMTTALGMSADQADTASKRLFSAATQMGVAPGVMASEFAAAGKQFASFGDNAMDAFIDLREVAKKTGLELNSLLSVTEKFTTFEGAAGHVGQLNAMLGGPFLNTIDMVNASLEDPAEAMLMVRDAVNDAGMSFQDMNPAMKRAVANAAGLEDASQLAALMAGDMSALGMASAEGAADMEALKEAAGYTQSLGEEIKATAAAFMVNFGPVIELIIDGLNVIQKVVGSMETWQVTAIGLVVLLGTMGLAFAGLAATIGTMVLPAAAAASSAAALATSIGTLATALTATTAAGKPASLSIKVVGKSATTSALGMLAFGAAVMMVGIGIGLAAAGMAALVLSFSQLSPEQIMGATLALLGLAVGLGVLMGAMVLIALSPPGQAGLLALLAIGAAIMMIGAGVGLAAAGMALMVSSIGELAGTAEQFTEIAAAFTALSIPKMITYTTAMAATAAVAMTPAGALLLAGAAVVGGKKEGAGGAQDVKVDVKIEGKMDKLFDVLDRRYTKLGATTPGGSSIPPRGYIGHT